MPSYSHMPATSSYDSSYSSLNSTMDNTSFSQHSATLYAAEPGHYYPDLTPQNVRTNKIYSQTYMYICCVCHDGPKIYNNQPRCVVCSHDACSNCQHVKRC
ncbi:hypothetical protein FE257_006465 [Aspergillus nanangensis]|uniref:Uncharacterized protein n=1 Tax=Aspergillus nanangensis TaxID=2582783 RepID=A0AAD4CXM1_ASPNN|nr:hypothetical protein FE257_006465 [Aspergillus nanangensis]